MQDDEEGTKWTETCLWLSSSKKQTAEINKWKRLGVEIVTSLSIEHHIRRIVKEANYLLVNIKIAFKYKDRMLKNKYLRHILVPSRGRSTSLVTPHEGGHVDMWNKVLRQAKKKKYKK